MIFHTHTVRPAIGVGLICVLHILLVQVSQPKAIQRGFEVAYNSFAADLCMHQFMRQHMWHINVSIRSPLLGIVKHGHNTLRLGLKIFTRLWLFIVNVFLKIPSFKSMA